MNSDNEPIPTSATEDPAVPDTAIRVSPFPNVRGRLVRLGASEPTSLLTILPHNLASVDSKTDLLYSPEAATIRSLLRANDVPYGDLFSKEERPPYLHLRSADWRPPVLFLAYALTQDPGSVLSVLELVAGYAAKATTALLKRPVAKLQVVVERSKKGACTKIDYEGPVDRIDDLLKLVTGNDDDRS